MLSSPGYKPVCISPGCRCTVRQEGDLCLECKERGRSPEYRPEKDELVYRGFGSVVYAPLSPQQRKELIHWYEEMRELHGAWWWKFTEGCIRERLQRPRLRRWRQGHPGKSPNGIWIAEEERETLSA